RGTPALRSGPADAGANGNGSLMRSLPLALWHRGSDEDLVRDAMMQSRVTHGHLRPQVCCALYCLGARFALHGAGRQDSLTAAATVMHRVRASDTPALQELVQHVLPERYPRPRGTGYVVDCLHSARHAVETTDSLEAAIRTAVLFGNDTDTTAC